VSIVRAILDFLVGRSRPPFDCELSEITGTEEAETICRRSRAYMEQRKRDREAFEKDLMTIGASWGTYTVPYGYAAMRGKREKSDE
jgi:hypothetical protein